MTELPNIVRERLKAAPVGLHPDPNLLTAFAEQALSDRERTQVLDHLSRCADCRDVVALATPPTQSAAVVAGMDTGHARNAPWFGWPTLRWGALAACVVIVGTAVLMQRNVKMPSAPSYAQKDATPAGDPLREMAPLTSADTVALGQKNSEPRIDKRSATQHAATRDEPVELRQQLALPATTFAKRGKQLNEEGYAFSGAPTTKLQVHTGMVSPPRPVPAQPARADEPQDLLSKERNAADAARAAAPKAASETVEVEASAAPVATPHGSVEKDEALGKAKRSSSAQYDALVATEPASPTDKTLVSAEVRGKLGAEQLYRHRAEVARWTISSDGQLQHSLDSGKTWQPVAVAERATFRALSANGPDLWVGGPAGLLYHSTDAGGHWIQVKPAAHGSTLTAAIAAIEFTDLQHGKLTTSTGEIWLTSDAGLTWRNQP